MMSMRVHLRVRVKVSWKTCWKKVEVNWKSNLEDKLKVSSKAILSMCC